MIVTDDRRLADLCRSMRSQGRAVPGLDIPAGMATHTTTGAWLQHERLGYNYRLSEVAAAIGLGQMRRFDDMMQRRQRVAQLYIQRLMEIKDIMLPTVEPGVVNSWFVFVVRLASQYTREERDRIIAGMRRHDIGAADYFPCIHLQPFYRERFGFKPGDFPIAENISQRTIALPFYNNLSAKDIDLVAQTLEVMISRENIKRS